MCVGGVRRRGPGSDTGAFSEAQVSVGLQCHLTREARARACAWVECQASRPENSGRGTRVHFRIGFIFRPRQWQARSCL